MKKLIAVGLWALLWLTVPAGNAPAKGRKTTYNLGSNILCSIQASSYLLCSDMGQVNIDGTPYVVTSSFTITNIYQYPSAAPITSANVGFDNATPQGGQNYNSPASGTYANYQVSVGFNGQFDGSLTFTLTRHVSIYGSVSYTADNAVLVID